MSNRKYFCPICKYFTTEGSKARHDATQQHKAKMVKLARDSFFNDIEAKKKDAQSAAVLQKISEAAQTALDRDSKLFTLQNHPLRWVSAKAEDGTEYLYNPATGETKWVDQQQHPSKPSQPPQAPSHHGWFTCRGVDGRMFYKNENTVATQMHKPVELGGSAEMPKAQPPKPVQSLRTVPSRPVVQPKPQTSPVSKEIYDLFEDRKVRRIDPDTGLGVWLDSDAAVRDDPPDSQPLPRKPLVFSFKKPRLEYSCFCTVAC